MYLFLTPEHISYLKQSLSRKDGEPRFLRFELEYAGETAMQKGPWSVTNSPAGAVSGNPHDYYSVGPYWWPDPSAPDPKKAPYIRRDGEVNPERYLYHHVSDFSQLADAGVTLCAAGTLLDHPEYLDRAAQLYQIWFVDEKTRMNPHMEYAQAIPNICNGRGIGIIELGSLDRIIFSLGFLEAAGKYSGLLSQMDHWISQMLDWLLNSSNGKEESVHGNNHEVYYNVHVGMCALRLGRKDVLEQIFRNYRQRILPQQMQPDGSLPLELERTKSLHYSLYCLDAMAILCEMAHWAGEDLWHYEVEGRSISKGIDFLLPALNNPYTWSYQEIDGEFPRDRLALQWAALRLERPDLAQLNQKLRAGQRLWIANNPFPKTLMEGYFFNLQR